MPLRRGTELLSDPRLHFEVSLRSCFVLLARHLEHRDPKELAGVKDRIGWLTWEECEGITPGSCSWLQAAPPS